MKVYDLMELPYLTVVAALIRKAHDDLEFADDPPTAKKNFGLEMAARNALGWTITDGIRVSLDHVEMAWALDLAWAAES